MKIWIGSVAIDNDVETRCVVEATLADDAWTKSEKKF